MNQKPSDRLSSGSGGMPVEEKAGARNGVEGEPPALAPDVFEARGFRGMQAMREDVARCLGSIALGLLLIGGRVEGAAANPNSRPDLPSVLILNEPGLSWESLTPWVVAVASTILVLVGVVVALLLNISRRRKSESRWGHLEEVYRMAITAANAVPYQRDFKGSRFTFMGENVLELTGYSSEEMTPELWAERTEGVVPLGNQEGLELEEAIARTRAGEFKQWHTESRFRHRDGSVRWILDSAAEIVDASGDHRGSVGMLMDVSQTKETAAMIAQTERFQRRLIETSPLLIYVYDLSKKRVVFSNRGFGSLLGYEGEEGDQADATLAMGLCHPDDNEKVLRAVSRWAQLDEQEVTTLEYRVRDTRGQWRWIFATNALFLKDDQGQAQQIIGTAREITEEKEAIRALVDSEGRYRSLVTALKEAVLVVNRAGRITTCNASAESLFGVAPDALVGRSYEELGARLRYRDGSPCTPEDEPVQATLRTGRSFMNRLFGLGVAEQRTVWLSVNSQPVFRPGSPAPDAAVASFFDMTQRVEADAVLAAQADLFRLNAEISSALAKPGSLADTVAGCARGLAEHFADCQVALWLRSPSAADGWLKVDAGALLQQADGAGLHSVFERLVRQPAFQLEPFLGVAEDLEPRLDPERVLGKCSIQGVGAIPLRARERSVGMLFVLSRRPWPDRVTEAICSVADRLGLGLQHQLDLEQEAVSFEHNQEVTRAILGISSHPALIQGDWETMAGRITGVASEVLTDSFVSLWAFLPNRTGLYCVSRSASNHSQPAVEARLDLERVTSIVRRLKNERVIESGSFAADDPIFEAVAAASHAREPSSFQAAGIRIGGVIEGVLFCRQPDAGDRWGLDRGLFLAALADQAAHAMLSGRRREAERQVRELNEELEQRVRVRTQELQERVTEVERLNAGMINLLEDLQAAQAESSLAAQQLEEGNRNLQSLNEELEAFSYSVSHDLRAPLRNMAGFIDLLRRHTESQLDENAKRYMGIIVSESARMGGLIDDLLKFSRIGRTAMHLQPTAPNSLVQAIQEQLQHEIATRVIEWRIGELPEVKADPTLLRLVFQNLIGNAVKFSRDRDPSRISVTAERRNEDPAEVVFRVEDNGAGFNMKYVDKLFGVFQRLHSSRQFEGSGIGLANVQRIIHRHGGRVWARGEEGKGASFFFSLPSE